MRFPWLMRFLLKLPDLPQLKCEPLLQLMLQKPFKNGLLKLDYFRNKTAVYVKIENKYLKQVDCNDQKNLQAFTFQIYMLTTILQPPKQTCQKQNALSELD